MVPQAMMDAPTARGIDGPFALGAVGHVEDRLPEAGGDDSSSHCWWSTDNGVVKSLEGESILRHAIQRQESVTEPRVSCRSQEISRPGPRRNHRGDHSDEICNDEYPHQ